MKSIETCPNTVNAILANVELSGKHLFPADAVCFFLISHSHRGFSPVSTQNEKYANRFNGFHS
jgi:hypothetical protein